MYWRNQRYKKNSFATFSRLETWFLNRFWKIKNGPTTPLCVTFFLSTFFLVPSPALSFLYIFFIPLFGLAGTFGLHCLKTFICASEHVCFSDIFAVLLLVTQQLIFLFVCLFLSWLHYCSIVLCLIVQQQCTHLPPTYPASVFDNHLVKRYRDTARFYYYYYYYYYYYCCCSAERMIELIFMVRA